MSTEIEARLNRVFRKVFRSPQLAVDAATTAKDIANWDSLNHLSLMHSIEVEFGIRFTTREIVEFKSVGDMTLSVANKIDSARERFDCKT